MKPAIRNTLIVVLLFGLTGVVTGIYLYTKKSPDLSKSKAHFTLQASELVDEFNQDETAASAKYIDKVVEVTGQVSAIELAGERNMNITLGDEDQMSGVICTFNNIADPTSIEIKEGEIITVRGVCSGMLMDVLLNNCVIVK